MSEPQQITQTATNRRAAEAELKTLIDRFAPDHRRLVSETRKSLLKRLPSAHEIVYEYRDTDPVLITSQSR